MFYRVAIIRTDVSEEHCIFIIGVRIGELGTTLVLTKATRRNIPEHGILHSHHRENLKSYNNTEIFSNVRIYTSFSYMREDPLQRSPATGCGLDIWREEIK
jgi:hypothetical protein